MTFGLEPMVIALVAAAIFALSGYFRQLVKDGGFTGFSFPKFCATLVVGAFVGAITQVLGLPLTQEYLETQLIVYAGAVVLIENMVVGLYRIVRPTVPVQTG